MKVWILALIAAAHLAFPLLANAAALDVEEEEEEEEEGFPYDPKDEPPVYRCKRDPTWKSLNYTECQALTEWIPDDVWSREDVDNIKSWLGDKEDVLAKCIDEAFAQATHDWALCDETKKTNVCEVQAPSVMSHFYRETQGHLMMIENVLSEQEAFGLEALSNCVQKHLPNELPFYEVREFGDETEDTHGMYNALGGNFVTFLQGLAQLYLPGVVASIYDAAQLAYYSAEWNMLEFPPPESLGVRTAEYLHYKKTGQLGSHADSGSIFSISVALSDFEDYTGGFFQLLTPDALFKVPRRSGIIFFSESDHSITEITKGERKVFVVELWENEDVPIGIPRPAEEDFEEYKEKRSPFVPKKDDAEEETQTTSDEL